MKTNDAYLGLDIGGTGAKAGIVDRSGALLGLGHGAFVPHVTDVGHVEIEIEAIERAVRKAITQAMRQAQAPVKAMAIVSQGQTFVSLDAKDRPLHPAIIWYDSRASEQADRLQKALRENGGQERLPEIETIATASKVLWLKEHAPDIMRKACRHLLLPDYFAYRLTGEAVTDPNTAASTGLYAESEKDYCQAALEAAGICKGQVARIEPPGRLIAKLRSRTAKAWGLNPNIRLIVGTNDQYAGAIGAGNCRPGIISETSGTCLALVTLTKRLPHPMPSGLFGGRFPVRPYFFALAYAKTAGVVLDWFREQFTAGESFEELNRQANKSPIGCRGLTVVPHFDGMISPRHDPALRGAFCNLTLQHTCADIYRAILESLAFSLRENVTFLENQNLAIKKIRCIGGGAKNKFWLQMKADVIGRPVEQPAITEAAVLGAAMLAAWGAGVFSSLAEASATWYRVGRVFFPNPIDHDRYEAPYRRYRELTGQTISRQS